MRVRIEPRLLREAVRLHYGTRLSTREIAHSTGLSRNSLKRLRRHLESIVLDVVQLPGWNDEQLYERLGCCRRRIFDPCTEVRLTQPFGLKREKKQRVRCSKLGQ